MSDNAEGVEQYDVIVEQGVLDEGQRKIKQKYAVALCVAATYVPETHSILIAAVCKDTDIPIPPKDKKEKKERKEKDKDKRDKEKKEKERKEKERKEKERKEKERKEKKSSKRGKKHGSP
nr:101 kDa malaria antigen [Helicoverpa armigera]